MMEETINNYDDILLMLDSFIREPAGFWNEFYRNREKAIPFFVNKPDENLAAYFEQEWIRPGKVLELGCGPGRNAVYFAKNGCSVDAVDLSEVSLQWAAERAEQEKVAVNFIQSNLFELVVDRGKYDIIYDSGCFHHIAPHRKITYLNLIHHALKPGGHFALSCFEAGGPLGGVEMSDWEVYRERSIKGGLGYTDEKLRTIFKDFEVVEIRKMKEETEDSTLFGVNGLLTSLFQKNK